MIGVFSSGIAGIPHLQVFLQEPWVFSSRWREVDCDKVVGWGLKPSAAKARQYAAKHQLPYLSLEDGFLRSVGLGAEDAPLSIVLDGTGVYYDAGQGSDLETYIVRALSDAQVLRAQGLVDAWQVARVSKYNHLPEFAGILPERYVLVADQTLGDASVQYGMASEESFQRMLDAASSGNPDCTVLVKVHPDVFAGHKKGYFDVGRLMQMPRVQVLHEDVHPVRLIEQAQAVYVVTSQLGFEALLWGKRVHTFGMPFYAGWGLTHDDLSAPERRGRVKPAVTLSQLVHAALIDYPRYINPEDGQLCEVETVLAHIALQRACRLRFSANIKALGFSRWKKPIVSSFFWGSKVKFVKHTRSLSAGDTLAVWGMKLPAAEIAALQHRQIELVCLEDGFLRSVGLGADLIRPVSWVRDTRGIYYDATRSSDIEHLFMTTDFTPALLMRAQALRQRIIDEGLTKYNVGMAAWRRPQNNARVILVPGQVESDASIRYGAAEIRTNLALLQAVRALNPDAYIVYKPHPDLQAGLRSRGQGEADVNDWCNEVVLDVPMNSLLTEVDEVHTLTSLTGFEALMRHIPVTTYGQPFYAGWQLTTDLALSPAVLARRGRVLTLDALVAVTLMLYPTYVSRRTGRFTTPEQIVDELVAWRTSGPGTMPVWRKCLRHLLTLTKAH